MLDSTCSINGVRNEVRDSYHPDDRYAYSHMIPYRITNYIDGLFHQSILCGAARLVGDDLIFNYSANWIMQLIACGPDARNFDTQVHSGWEQNVEQGLYVKRKPQSFAGPAALAWANKCGANIPRVWVPDVSSTAKLFVRCGWAFGYLVRWVSWLRQHVNSMFLAYLLLGKIPPSSMEWLAYDNPFYKLIYGKKYVIAQWPLGYKSNDGKLVDSNTPVEFKDREPDAWPVKNHPYRRYVREGVALGWRYTPLCELATFYSQECPSGIP